MIFSFLRANSPKLNKEKAKSAAGRADDAEKSFKQKGAISLRRHYPNQVLGRNITLFPLSLFKAPLLSFHS